jgi:hypothetical protein
MLRAAFTKSSSRSSPKTPYGDEHDPDRVDKPIHVLIVLEIRRWTTARPA